MVEFNRPHDICYDLFRTLSLMTRFQMEIMERAAFILALKCKIRRRTAVVYPKNIMYISVSRALNVTFGYFLGFSKGKEKKTKSHSRWIAVNVHPNVPLKPSKDSRVCVCVRAV